MKKTAKSSKKKVGKADIIDAVKKPLLVIAGMVVGSFGGKAIDTMLKVADLPDGFNVKKLVRPLVLMGAGVAGSILIKNDDVKLVAAGVTGSGIATGIKVFLKKDILNGLAGIGDGGELGEDVVTQLTIEPYNPELKDLGNADQVYLPESNINGFDAVDYTEVDVNNI